jgi:uncharacterized protein YqgV (UPF0045/DUF77 family)
MKCMVFVVRVTAPCGNDNGEQMESLVQRINKCIERQEIEAQLECLPTTVCALKELTFERKHAFSTI